MGEISPLLSSLAEEDISYSSKIIELVSYWILGNTCYPHANGCRQKKICDVMNRKLEMGFALSKGPFVKGVEAVLQSLKCTTPEVYHGAGCINGHHPE